MSIDDFVNTLPCLDDVQQRINSRFDALFHKEKNSGALLPYVCTFCDEFLLHEKDINFVPIDTVKKKKKLFAWSQHVKDRDRIPELEEAFHYKDRSGHIRDVSFLDGLALSPRGVVGRKHTGRGARWGFSSCGTCKWAIENSRTPFYSIVNQNFVGNAPACLRELTEVELALVTPVKGSGYCFTYNGGKQMNLKGTLVFMRVQERKVTRAAVQLERYGLTRHVLILVTGSLTKKQKERVKEKKTIRTEKVLAAVYWLINNHRRWKEVDIEDIRKELENLKPIVIDRSSEVEDVNANIETRELFHCYLPDGATNNKSGGFDDAGAFQEYVEQMQRDSFDVQVRLNIEKESTRGMDGGDELMSACLLQFPYGVGGSSERRIKQDGTGKYTDTVDLQSFLTHLSLLAQPEFQTPMFQLAMYTQISRARLLKRSRLQLKGKRAASALAEGIDPTDLRRTVQGRQRGNRNAGSYASRQLLNSVEAISRALPHTNEATRLARSSAETLQHYFGIGTIWLTVNFDDENSLLLQVLSGRMVDDDCPLENLNDEDLSKRYKERCDIRLQLPGLSSMNFEILIHIVFEEVLGWDMRRNCPTEQPGLFGRCEAVLMALEEQGRKSIHGHITAWIRHFQQLRKMMFFGDRRARQLAAKVINKYHDTIATTSLFSLLTTHDMKQALDHNCDIPMSSRPLPEVVDEQTLRDLRHKKGYEYHNGKFAYCPICGFEWTYEKMLEKVVRKKSDIPGMVEEDDPDEYELPKARLRARIIQFQKETIADPSEETPSLCINANYQHHVSHHLPGCFKCKSQDKTKHTCGPKCECRFRVPDVSRQKSTIKYYGDNEEGVTWYTWDGREQKQPLVSILPARSTYDLFQNVSCKAISESKLSCNSNVAIVTDGPISQYNIKYQVKDTTKDDTKEYQYVQRTIKDVEGRVHEDDRKEALRLICRAAFAHNLMNVIAPILASLLIRWVSRFYFSHEFAMLPLNDFIRILRNETVDATLTFTPNGENFFENQALHYLCRPRELEKCSSKEFFERYTVRYLSKKRKRDDEESCMPLIADTGYFQHPSVDKKGHVQQCVIEREKEVLIKVSQWKFPDTARFRTSILTAPPSEMTREMDQYAELVLILFLPFRQLADLKPRHQPNHCYSYVQKLQDVYNQEALGIVERQVFTDANVNFLQNIQNAAYNSLRYKVTEDDLKSRTHPFTTDEMRRIGFDSDDDDEEDDDDDDDDQMAYEAILDQFDEVDSTDSDPVCLPQHMSDFSFCQIRNEGSKGCGYNKDLPTPPVTENLEDWICGHSNLNQSQSNAHTNNSNFPPPSINRIVEVFLSKKHAKTKPEIFERNKEEEVIDADGSIASIKDWGRAAGLDTIQQRAFECIVASFLLSFYDDAESEDDGNNDETSSTYRARFRRQKKHLLKLKGDKKSQLVCLLHGPGGSGKSTVINLVVHYAKEFCNILGYPFTSRTIVITAMSGVAATLLHGETTHKAIGLNRKFESIQNDEELIEAWRGARLVIIDEVSFACEEEFDKIYNNLGAIMQDTFKPFGGLSIVFAGDYSQLEPPGKGRVPVYKYGGCPSFTGQLTTYIELDGKHRFNKDPEWGERLLRFRQGEPTLDDINYINTHCLVSPNRQAPPNVQVATYKNIDRDAVNCAIFERYCEEHGSYDGTVWKGAAVILMDDVCMVDQRGSYVSVKSNGVLRTFWSQVGEAGASKERRQRIDPCLKLYPGCPLMLTENADVPSGQANGSRVNLVKIHIKSGEQFFPLKLASGVMIPAFRANQIKSIQVKHEFDDITPNQFHVEPEEFKFSASFRMKDGDEVRASMSGVQFPLISNSCTTGHKLQGYTATSLLVNDWHYGQNWAYVVLSRVRTMAGLYIMQPLTDKLEKYKMPKAMLDMIESCRQRFGLKMIDDSEYEQMLTTERTWFEN